MRPALAAVPLLTAFLLAACPANDRADAPRADAVATADDEEALEQLARRYEQAVRASDRQAVEQMFTGDAWLSFGSGVSGSPREVVDDAPAELTLEDRRTEVIGDWAYATGTWRQGVPAPDGTTQQLEGHYLTVFRRENGEWRIREVVSNLSEESQRRMAQVQQAAPN